MPSRSRSRSSSTRRKRSAATRIQKTLRGKHGRTRAKKFRSIKRNNAIKENECPICSEPLTQDVRVLRCGHRFHNECIENGLRAGITRCGLCRTPIVEPDDQEEEEEEEQIEEARLEIIFLQVQQLENEIFSMRQQLPQPPTVPNITLNEALNNQTMAAQIERRVTTNHNEVALYYNNLRTMRQRTRPNWTGADETEAINQTIFNLYSYTSEVLANAINNTRNASRILVVIGNR